MYTISALLYEIIHFNVSTQKLTPPNIKWDQMLFVNIYNILKLLNNNKKWFLYYTSHLNIAYIYIFAEPIIGL